MEAVFTIVNVVQKIVKAAETARQNRKRCLDLADRARTVGDILREDRDSTTSRLAGGGGVTMLMRRPPLDRLKAALDDALELVESQRSSGLGIPKLITSGRTAARFQDVETRITACVVDLGLAEQIAARRREHRANAEAVPAQEARPPPQGKDGPSFPQQQGKNGPSLPQGNVSQSVAPPESLFNQYLPQSAPLPPQQGNDFLQSYLAQSAQKAKDEEPFLQAYLAQCAQKAKEGELFMQSYLAESTQKAKDEEPFLQAYLAQSAQKAKEGESFMQNYLAQSAQKAKEGELFMQSYLAQSAQKAKDAQPFLQAYLGQSASSQQQGQDVQSLLKGYGYFTM